MNRDVAVIGAATGYQLDDLLPFVVSLKRTGFAGRVVLFVWDLESWAIQVLTRLGVELMPCALPDTGRRLTVTGGRFLVYRQWLQQEPSPPAHILLTDVRDVIFQRDPFAADPAPGLHCFLEDSAQTIGSEPFNRQIVLQAYGPEVLSELSHRPIACVGTVLGDVAHVRGYLDELIPAMGCITEDFFGSDQAAHNLLLHTGRLPKAWQHANGQDLVAHLGLVEPEALRQDETGLVVDDTGRVIPVIHQYDRHPILAARLKALLA